MHTHLDHVLKPKRSLSHTRRPVLGMERRQVFHAISEDVFVRSRPPPLWPKVYLPSPRRTTYTSPPPGGRLAPPARTTTMAPGFRSSCLFCFFVHQRDASFSSSPPATDHGPPSMQQPPTHPPILPAPPTALYMQGTARPAVVGDVTKPTVHPLRPMRRAEDVPVQRRPPSSPGPRVRRP
jgi:hypothetical protein